MVELWWYVSLEYMALDPKVVGSNNFNELHLCPSAWYLSASLLSTQVYI